MKKVTRQELPAGWNEKKVLAVIAHYDQQTEDEAAAEIETAPEATGETLMSVPTELVGAVTRLIKNHAKNGATARPRNHKGKAPAKKPRPVGQFADAEPLVKEGYEGMKQHEKTMPPAAKERLTEALERLVQLYDATGNAAAAERYRKELAERKAAQKEPKK